MIKRTILKCETLICNKLNSHHHSVVAFSSTSRNHIDWYPDCQRRVLNDKLKTTITVW